MKRIPFLYAAGLPAAAVMAAGVLWFALHRSPAPKLLATPASIEQLQQLATPAVAVTSAPLFIDTLRAVKAFLVRNPGVKTAYAPATFSWRRDLFDHLTAQFNAVLLQKPDQATLAKILSLVDAIADEFEADNAGKQYNAEVDVAAQNWRNSMYDAVRGHTTQPVTASTKILQPLSAGISHQATANRGATDLTQKVMLKDKKLPMAQATPAAQPNTVQNTQNYASEASTSQGHNGHASYASDYDDDLLADYDFFHPDSSAYNAGGSGYSSSPATSKKQTNIPSASAPTAATASKPTQQSTGLGGSSSTPTDNNISTNDQAIAQQAQDQEKFKQTLAELQKFMLETKEISDREKPKAERECRVALGI